MNHKKLNSYRAVLEQIEKMKTNIETSIETEVGKTLYEYGKCLFIGNMVYRAFDWYGNGKPIPMYCYASDYKGTNVNPFYPIYDKNGNLEFGWADFNECCKIYDVILKELEK